MAPVNGVPLEADLLATACRQVVDAFGKHSPQPGRGTPGGKFRDCETYGGVGRVFWKPKTSIFLAEIRQADQWQICEMAWREDFRRVSNGGQFVMIVDAAMSAPVSRQWKGYWQRAAQ